MNDLLKNKILPTNPGVYQFYDENKKIIYVGKAKNLKNRIKNYFSKNEHSTKTQHLVKRIRHIETIITDNEIEALLLENKLIKAHKPKYNIHLKDSKTFAYLKITDEQYPRLISTRRRTKKGTYYGPYTDGQARRELQRLANKLFKLRTCKNLPKKECLNYHIGLCSAPCIQNISKKEYDEQIINAQELLSGKTNNTKKVLEKEMHRASREQHYEKALEKREQLRALNHLAEKQKVDTTKNVDQDVIIQEHNKETTTILVLPIRKGVLRGKEQYRFETQEELFEQFIKQYYATRLIPHEIITQETIHDPTIHLLLEQQAGRKVLLTNPQQGEKKQLLELAKKNITQEHEETHELQNKLNLATTPTIIECFDISNLKNEAIVAGMTRYINGEADTQGYRRYLLDQDTQDDYKAMKEVITRRYKKLQAENQELPDLIVIDGGPGQLRSAMSSLQSLGLQIPLVALAKREEELYTPGRKMPYRYDKQSPMMLYLRKIRDSTHRQAISYNKKRRAIRLREDS